MPLFFQQDINEHTRLAVWKIEEDEAFFDTGIPLQRQITHPHKRLQHMAGRFLLPYLFADFPADEIAIADTRKPYLPGEQYHFSISHCRDFAAAIVSRYQRVGIDVEEMTPRVATIRHKFLNAQEQAFVATHGGANDIPLLTTLWSAKEALFKWYALGGVDFSEMMHIYPFELLHEGSIKGAFIARDLHADVDLHYRMWEGQSLVWVATDQFT